MTDHLSTYFASPERLAGHRLERHLDLITNNAVICSVLASISGFLAVLNQQRQILTVNEDLCQFLGEPDLSQVFGLRVGEAIGCIHANKGPGGCGTGKHCRSCGAVLSMLAALEHDRPVEKDCAATVQANGQEVELFFQVRSQPILIGNEKFLLFFLRDQTEENRRVTMERVFFHDMTNMLQVLMGYAEFAVEECQSEGEEIYSTIQEYVRRLCAEVDLHKTIAYSRDHNYPLRVKETTLQKLVAEAIGRIGSRLNGSQTRIAVDLDPEIENQRIQTDASIVVRVLMNMLNNALDAATDGDVITFSVDPMAGQVKFSVHNPQIIPRDHQLRIFQRHFTTKQGIGHGYGTYSMKLLGETVLGGEVGFYSGSGHGTTFWLLVPDKTA